jgi:hypothetical protein
MQDKVAFFKNSGKVIQAGYEMLGQLESRGEPRTQPLKLVALNCSILNTAKPFM